MAQEKMQEINVTVILDGVTELSDEMYAAIADAAFELNADDVLLTEDEEGVYVIAGIRI